jgi:hypothetical protein
MSLLPPRHPERECSCPFQGWQTLCLAPLSRSTPKARRGAKRGVDGGSASRARSTLEWTTLKPLDNPFGTRLSPMSQVRSVTYVPGLDKTL